MFTYPIHINQFCKANDLPMGLKNKTFDWKFGSIKVVGVSTSQVICESEGLGLMGFNPKSLKPFIK